MITSFNDISILEEANAVLVTDTSRLFADPDDTPAIVGGYKIAKWGIDNLLPSNVLKQIDRSDVMGANVRFNAEVMYGLGPRLVRVTRDATGKIVDRADVTDGQEYDFFEANDIPLYLLSLMTDMSYFYNAFTEIAPSTQGKIKSIRHLEAAFSRWGIQNSKGVINYHYYCSDWTKASSDNVTRTYVIDEYDSLTDLKRQIALRKNSVFPTFMPSPGRPYYSRPEWYSLFQSGWFDHSVAIPELKKALVKNQLGLKFIIYVAPEYFEDILKDEGIDLTDTKAVTARIDKEKADMCEFLAGGKNAGKALLCKKPLMPSGNGVSEHKYIEVIPIQNKIDGGEYIDDTESCANIICYAMGVHPSLIGATPGKNGGSIGGTDKRELFLMKQALMKPAVSRCMRPLSLVKRVNKWDKDILVELPEYIFTTLDQNKSGKQESTTVEE